MDLSTHALTPEDQVIVFGVCQDLIGGEALASYQSLYLYHSASWLHLNAFRGVRAIAQFDWPFTYFLSTIVSFSTLIGAVLQLALPNLQSDQG